MRDVDEADDFLEDDEPLEEIFDRFARGERGLTALPPGGQALPSEQFIAVWPFLGHYDRDESSLVQA